MGSIHDYVSENDLDHFEEVIHFFLRTASLLRNVGWNIGCSDDHFVEKWEDQHDATILIFEKGFIFSKRSPQLWLVQDQVGIFGASNKARIISHAPASEIDPWDSRIDDNLWLYIEDVVSQLVP